MRRTITKRTHRTCERVCHTAECHDVARGQAKASPKHLRHRGIALAWTALVIIAIGLLVGLSIDWAKLLYNLHELQNAADAAALAGAQVVKVSTPEETRLRTQEIAYENTAEKLDVYLRTTAQDEPFVEDPNIDIILGRWINNQHYFFPTLDGPDAVKVIARREDADANAPALAFLYGPLVDVYKAKARGEAIGWYCLAGGAGLIILDEEPNDPKTGDKIPGLLIADNVGNIQVLNGSIQVNTIWEGTKWNNDPPAALCVKAGGDMLCGRLTITGHTDPQPPIDEDDLNGWDDIWEDPDLGQMPYDILEGAPYMPDPLRNLVPPTIPTDPNDANNYIVKSYTKDTPATLEPGYYPDGIEISSSAPDIVVNLKPGTYIIGGGNDDTKASGLIVNGGKLTAHGVLIYLTKDYGTSVNDPNDDGNWAQLDIAGNVVTEITPPGDEVTPKIINGLEGVSIWQDRANTENQAELNGEQGINVSGTLYFPNNHVYLAGNPGKTGNQILCGSLEVFGKAQVVVEYDGRNNQCIGVSVLVK